MKKRTEQYENIKENFDFFRKQMPEIDQVYDNLPDVAYSEGEIDSKTKRMMALCVALCTKCDGCILHQSEEALKEGATARELLETCAVAISMGGTQSAAESTKVVQLLKEKGKL